MSAKPYKPPSDAAYSYIEEGDDAYMMRAQKFDHSFVEDESFDKQARKGVRSTAALGDLMHCCIVIASFAGGLIVFAVVLCGSTSFGECIESFSFSSWLRLYFQPSSFIKNLHANN